MERLKLQTPVEIGRSKVSISLSDKIVSLGSCFSDNIGAKMKELGFEITANPFGTIYNPVSICNSAARLCSGHPFSPKDCVGMGAGSNLVCSFSHHTSFARPTQEEFLDNANAVLSEASSAWKACGKVIITLGTAWYFEHTASGEIVSNCLKIDAKEFERKRLGVRETVALLGNMVMRNPEKEFIFTVSPIRHFRDGAHGNLVSKSTLILAAEEICSSIPDRCSYFPAYEIVMDELRDYRFYAEDMVHPSRQTIDYLWARFSDFAVSPSDLHELEERRKELLHSAHRQMH